MAVWVGHLFILLSLTSVLSFLQCGQCQVKDTDLFPFDVEEDARFQFNDDDFTRHNFTIPFNFFNKTYQLVYISGNGQISFGEGVTAFTPQCLPSSIPMIMAYWSDADNTVDKSDAKLLFRETTERRLLKKAAGDIFKAFPDLKGISLSWMFIVTWKDIPFYGATSACNGTSQRNTFQLTLTTDGLHSFAQMYYSKIEWTTGTMSRGNCRGLEGNTAKAGFDYGDMKTWYTVPGSCTDSIVNITQTSNINEPGKWVFRIDSNLKTASCKEFDESKQKLRLNPSVVNSFGNVPLKISGPCVHPNDTVLCIYRENTNAELEGTLTADSKAVVCPMPSFNFFGRKIVILKIISKSNRSGAIPHAQFYKGYLYVINDNEMWKDGEIKIAFNRSSTDNSTIFIDAKWDPDFVNRELDLLYGATAEDRETGYQRRKRSATEETLDFSLDAYNGRRWKQFGTVRRNINNTGAFRGPIHSKLVDQLIDLQAPKLLALSLSRNSEKEKREANFLKKKISSNPVTTFYNFYETASLINPRGIAEQNHSACKAWSYLSDPPPADTLPCPPIATLAQIDANFQKDESGDFVPLFHAQGAFSVLQKIPSNSKGGSQCVYDKDGNLIVGSAGGGTSDRYSPNYSVSLHALYDIVPYLFCCKLPGFLHERKCTDDIYKVRPPMDATGYRLQRVFRGVGDPHITTFDGLTYTFNGVGEFWMVKAEDTHKNVTFAMQVRMEQYFSPGGLARKASVFTAAAMEEIQNGYGVAVQVSYTDGQILVTLDGENLQVDDDELPLSGLILQHKSLQMNISANDVTITFSTGFSFKFSTVGPNENALNILGMADADGSSEAVAVAGLMGNCDGDRSNDLKQPNGTVLSVNSTTQEIHHKFGLQWRVEEEQSIFTYLAGKTYSDYCRPDFLPNFMLDLDTARSIPQAVLEACDGHNECLFDYTTTGSEAIASGTKASSMEYDSIAQVTSTVISVCPSPMKWYPENGYAEVTNSLIGGTLTFFCDEGYQMKGGVVNCTCAGDAFTHTYTDSYNYRKPDWLCNRATPFPINCISPNETLLEKKESEESSQQGGPIECDAPPHLTHGHVVGSNFSIGSEIELACKNHYYDLHWNNCIFNGERGICEEMCNVTYTCVRQRTTSKDGETEVHAVWEGYGGDISGIVCYSKSMGKAASILREAALLLQSVTNPDQIIPESLKRKPYLVGC